MPRIAQFKTTSTTKETFNLTADAVDIIIYPMPPPPGIAMVVATKA